MSDKPKWRIRKSNGAWIVRKPNGSHFGAYYTHAEALAQATHRKSVATAGGGGYFERDNDPHNPDHRYSRYNRERPIGFGFTTINEDEDHQ